MKKQVINYDLPAIMFDFSKDQVQENFTRGKLKVFYKGETADHRYFSDSFSEDLIQSLPYTPVVSYYDSEKDDFVGHATEQQILGIVDPCIKPSFELDEDGKEWAICDVVLYTERPDMVGDLAQKIVGHPQSLELDPNSVKYTINYDEKMHFKNIEFTAGKFIGVSVLGMDQKPAFTGSAFFSYDEQFENKMKILREYCESKHDQNVGGNEMNLKEFLKLSWGDISLKVSEAIEKEYCEEAFTMVMDMYEDNAVIRWYSYIDGSSKLLRVYYSINENGEVTLGNANEVYISYQDIITPSVAEYEETGAEQIEEFDSEVETEPVVEESVANVVEETASTEITSEEVVETEEANFVEDTVEETVETTESVQELSIDADCKEETEEVSEPAAFEATEEIAAAQEESAEIIPNTESESSDDSTAEKVSVDNEDQTDQGASSTSFTESERAEFEALKREKKINLIDSYKDFLTTEEIEKFTENIDNFSDVDLERELLLIYKRSQEQVQETPMRRAFAFAPVNNNANNKDSLDNYISRMLGK